jgi:hypothetical protein
MKTVRDKSDTIRAARTRTLWLFVSFPFVGLIVVFLAEKLALPDEYWLVPMVLYAAVVLYFSKNWTNAICPVCERPMFRKWVFYYGFRRCVACGYNLKEINSSSTTPKDD